MKLIAKITDENIGESFSELINPKTRTAVRTILLDNNNNIAILHKKSKNEYKLIGGGVDDGENLEEALKREALEESGCTINILSCMGYIEEYRSKMNFYQKSYIYLSKVVENTHNLHLTQKEKDEEAELCWFKPQQALELMRESYNNLCPSKYSNLYSTKLIVARDTTILDYYLQSLNKL